ncbi:hypothetical protein CGRA01v4_11395 [Colletotrichum graminicola]|uniref:Uncharacterized protein n=1 Tax=Colletotrichum graminicola (strain M1.001 / M2 / FGSC 10212) TaxID=645133 RepID=E3QDU5_COLGM|nr:uncharacterized protein GLRG_04177 [Colletotrichum graminicola M1.001]EFQ29033.1 hypothetical protein GLRG_04177 [Colletotrichum graminicola M1.001]WDK20108.1 hypothetical protein CGRA01v4_11395 [Colletotrichum graminicola]
MADFLVLGTGHRSLIKPDIFAYETTCKASALVHGHRAQKDMGWIRAWNQT